VLPTLVLDKAYKPCAIFDSRKAFLLVVLNKCQVLETYSCSFNIKTSSSEFKRPLVIRIPILQRHWDYFRPSRQAIFLRDNYTCAYCGQLVTDRTATIDHIVPKSRGGEWSWENLITCCSSCNQMKGNKTPEEAQMTLLFKPYEPKKFELELALALKRSFSLQLRTGLT